jgi:NhaP-type Na+/H+ or K+/H+ antiporter
LDERPKPLSKLMTSAYYFCADAIGFSAFLGGKTMLTSLALVFLLGLAAAALCSRIGLPRIIGMLLTGILIGPYVLNWLDDSILSISSDLRRMALIIILIKAGLSLDLSDLKRVGRPAVMMACVPASCEILAFFLLAPHILGINRIEAAVMGAVLGAVSPAVVVPRMVQLMEEKRGTGQGIPQMILAGASCDDIYVIVLFSTFVGMAQGGSANMMDFVNIPISIALGVALGAAVGLLLHLFLETAYRHGCYVRNSTKVILILGLSFLLIAVETWLKGIVSVSGLLAVMSMACVLKIKSSEKVTKRLSAKFGKLWIAAEAILFVLVGAAVDIRCAAQAGAAAVLMIALALVFRAVGVSLCMLGTRLNRKERLFCVIAYLPKATVQAAIGSVPLSMGLPCGQLVLSVAVLAILITAPLGAIGIDRTAGRLLMQENSSDIAE